MNFVFSLFFYLISPSPELIKDYYFTFYNKEKFYIVQQDSVYETLDGSSFNSWPHGVNFTHFNFKALNTKEGLAITVDFGGGDVREIVQPADTPVRVGQTVNVAYRVDGAFISPVY